MSCGVACGIVDFECFWMYQGVARNALIHMLLRVAIFVWGPYD